MMETNRGSVGKHADGTDDIIFSLDNFAEFLADDFSISPRQLFQPFAVNDMGRLALTTRSGCLIITDGTATSHGTHAVEGEVDTVIELTAGAVVSALLWVSDRHLFIGFEHGNLVCFNVEGQLLFERQYHEERITSLRISGNEDGLGSDGFLWAMFAKGLLVQIVIHDFLVGYNDENCVKYKFVENTVFNDFVVLPTVYASSIFGVYEESKLVDTGTTGTHSLLIAGRSDAHDMGGGGALSLYNVGGKQHFQHLGKLGNFVKTQVSTAISRAFQSLLPSTTAQTSGKSNATQAALTTKVLASLVDFEDPKRHVLRLSQDPSGVLVAAADSLGRVVLYDSSLGLHVVVRLWKGVRDAQLAWSSSTSTLCLGIYAPQLGVLSFYAMKHGPCMRVVPVPIGSLCQLYTRISSTNASTSCHPAHRR